MGKLNEVAEMICALAATRGIRAGSDPGTGRLDARGELWRGGCSAPTCMQQLVHEECHQRHS
jgi:hypothetical protein